MTSRLTAEEMEDVKALRDWVIVGEGDAALAVTGIDKLINAAEECERLRAEVERRIYFVFYDFGSCNYGDHQTGLEPFSTEEAARTRIAQLKKEQYDPTISLIRGEMLDD